MDLATEYWVLIAAATAVVVVLLFLLLRPRQRITLTESAPVRPHMAYAKPEA